MDKQSNYCFPISYAHADITCSSNRKDTVTCGHALLRFRGLG